MFFAGGWEAYARAGDALAHLGDFCETTAANLGYIAADLDEGWDGNASDAAVAYFSGVAQTV
ncbi:hypothetical protein [Dactylosporangium salmoneum]|uniref:Uncharacterized protein n=1 Tax=Dactylosporangium salmoneum TaxID=53361 RepID=A0ABP5SY30_9ACTN